MRLGQPRNLHLQEAIPSGTIGGLQILMQYPFVAWCPCAVKGARLCISSTLHLLGVIFFRQTNVRAFQHLLATLLCERRSSTQDAATVAILPRLMWRFLCRICRCHPDLPLRGWFTATRETLWHGIISEYPDVKSHWGCDIEPQQASRFLNICDFPISESCCTGPLWSKIFRSFYGRIPAIYRGLSFDKTLVARHHSTHQFIMSDSRGALSAPWRHYLALAAAAVHRCDYLVRLQEVLFLSCGGDPDWLSMKDAVPIKLRRVLALNLLLAHRPWRITAKDLQELTNKGQPWTITELCQAILIFTHYHMLAGLCWGLGLTAGDLEDLGSEWVLAEPPIETVLPPCFLNTEPADLPDTLWMVAPSSGVLETSDTGHQTSKRWSSRSRPPLDCGYEPPAATSKIKSDSPTNSHDSENTVGGLKAGTTKVTSEAGQIHSASLTSQRESDPSLRNAPQGIPGLSDDDEVHVGIPSSQVASNDNKALRSPQNSNVTDCVCVKSTTPASIAPSDDHHVPDEGRLYESQQCGQDSRLISADAPAADLHQSDNDCKSFPSKGNKTPPMQASSTSPCENTAQLPIDASSSANHSPQPCEWIPQSLGTADTISPVEESRRKHALVNSECSPPHPKVPQAETVAQIDHSSSDKGDMKPTLLENSNRCEQLDLPDDAIFPRNSSLRHRADECQGRPESPLKRADSKSDDPGKTEQTEGSSPASCLNAGGPHSPRILELRGTYKRLIQLLSLYPKDGDWLDVESSLLDKVFARKNITDEDTLRSVMEARPFLNTVVSDRYREEDIGYQDFDMKSEASHMLHVFGYSLDDTSLMILDCYYPGAAQVLADEIEYLYSLTDYTLGGRRVPTTKPIRNAVWLYVLRLYGIQHDDYHYGAVNNFMALYQKVFVKKLVCYPERLTQNDFRRPLEIFNVQDMIHYTYIACHGRRMATLMFALNAVGKTMNS
eukprot:GHVT01097058.1.p1 GENE.GHVT01097058.1~~GHVT01097058.1.p1  ORF type:complete len:950 (-),score=68.36 GHVT01097058.1:718-3567(-)